MSKAIQFLTKCLPARKITILCPTRQRNLKAQGLALSFLETDHSDAKLVFGIDADCVGDYDLIQHPHIEYLSIPRGEVTGAVRPVNIMAGIYQEQSPYLGVLGDDAWIISKNWQTRLLEEFKRGFGIVYCEDNCQPWLAGHVFVDSRIPKRLGHLLWPGFWHLCADNVLKDIGAAAGLKYMTDVVIEHRHYFQDASRMDEVYAKVNSDKTREHDNDAYRVYLERHFRNEARLVSEVMKP